MMQELKSIFSQRDMAEEYGENGELYFSNYLSKWEIPYVPKPTKTSKWDFRIMDIYIDVKTLVNNYKPRYSYYVNVSALQLSADIEIYAFVFYNCVKDDMTLVGATTPRSMATNGMLKRKGETERGNFVYPCDTYIMQLNDLLPFVGVLDTCLCKKYGGVF
jgi:hypothetical protein